MALDRGHRTAGSPSAKVPAPARAASDRGHDRGLVRGSGAHPIISMIPIEIGNHRTVDGDGDKTCKRSKHDNTAPTTANDENVT